MELLSIFISGAVVLSILIIIFVSINKYFKRREMQQIQMHDLQKMQLEMERHRQEQEEKFREKEFEIKKEAEESKRDTGGYIILEMPGDKRSAFIDLLKGFEDYARLRGYSVFFSFDSSIPDKVAFKFTVAAFGITVSKEQIRKDLEDYIEKVKSGGRIEDIPIVLNKQEHDLLITTLANRINFLYHNYKLVSNTLKYYERLLNRGIIASV